MGPRLATTLATYGLLCAVGGLSFVLPDHLGIPEMRAAGPATTRVPGIVRDFKATHPDFASVTPDQGWGHYAGLVELTDGSGGRPVFSGGGNGYKVAAQWYNGASNPIAPHLFALPPPPGSSIVNIRNAPTFGGGGYADTFSSDMGPYGGSNVGPAPTYDTSATIPTVSKNAVERFAKRTRLPQPKNDRVSLIARRQTRYQYSPML